MVNIPTDSPITLIEFELHAFKNALALESGPSNNKPVLLFPNHLDPVVNRVIRILASRMKLDSCLVGDYPFEVVIVYPRDYIGEKEEENMTMKDFTFDTSLKVCSSDGGIEIEPSLLSTSFLHSNLAALDLATTKGDGRKQRNLKGSMSSAKSFEYLEQYSDLKKEEPIMRGIQNAKTKWVKSVMSEKELSQSSTVDTEESEFQSYSDVVFPAIATSTPLEAPPIIPQPTNQQEQSQTEGEKKTFDLLRKDSFYATDTSSRGTVEMTHTSADLPTEPSWTEDWGAHEALLLPLEYIKTKAPDLLSEFTDPVPGTVSYYDKCEQPLDLPAVIYVLPPDDEGEEDAGRKSPTPGPSNRP